MRSDIASVPKLAKRDLAVVQNHADGIRAVLPFGGLSEVTH